ncbi:tryptophan synthase subunit alpha [Candidatus Daviesbacteria bacterium]|nr:tryptophan synthase subunit alpha [Candidatus Daviesbacteria bacterium]
MGLNLIDQQIKNKKRIRLMTHLVIGFPSLDFTIKLAKLMAKNGADFIELQIPFSDPLADGPTIMKACEESLLNGTKVKDAFKIMKLLSSQVSIPLLFMAYYNTVFKYGVKKFCQDAKLCGASGLIVPDMPVDEENEEHLISNCRKFRLCNIQVISPVSTNDRLQKNAKVASGFVYATAHQGITGAKNQLESSLEAYLKKVKKYFSVPIAVGFGISQKEHLEKLAPLSDIAVIGSAVINVINLSNKDNIEEDVKNFINNLKIC